MTERIIDGVSKNFVFRGPVEVAYDPKVRALCTCPYEDHPKGCPLLGKKSYCPPLASLFNKKYQEGVYIMAYGMDLSQFLSQRSMVHPDWTPRACLNLRHWQGAMWADLLKKSTAIQKKEGQLKGFELITNPEAMGVNLFETVDGVGLKLNRNPLGLALKGIPEVWVYKIALLARRK
jgi:hypothetical protein